MLASLNRFVSVPDITLFSSAQISGGGGGGEWYIIIDNVYIIGVVACPGWWLGLSGRVTQSVRVAMCRQGRVHVTFTSAPTTSPRYPGVVKIVRKRKLFFEHG